VFLGIFLINLPCPPLSGDPNLTPAIHLINPFPPPPHSLPQTKPDYENTKPINKLLHWKPTHRVFCDFAQPEVLTISFVTVPTRGAHPHLANGIQNSKNNKYIKCQSVSNTIIQTHVQSIVTPSKSYIYIYVYIYIYISSCDFKVPLLMAPAYGSRLMGFHTFQRNENQVWKLAGNMGMKTRWSNYLKGNLGSKTSLGMTKIWKRYENSVP